MRVLLIEDDPATARSVELALTAQRMVCDTALVGKEGVEIGQLYRDMYDIIILDLGLPDIDGYEVLRQLRAAKITTPVLIVSGASCTDSKIRGLISGADDYMIKPYHQSELVARIQAIVRRAKGHADSVIRIGVLAVNLDERTVCIDDTIVYLTGKEYLILELLALRKGSVLTKEAFLNHLYGGMEEPEIKIIDVFICKLRKKLADASGGINFIETVWGRGYVLREPAPAVSAVPEPVDQV